MVFFQLIRIFCLHKSICMAFPSHFAFLTPSIQHSLFPSFFSPIIFNLYFRCYIYIFFSLRTFHNIGAILHPKEILVHHNSLSSASSSVRYIQILLLVLSIHSLFGLPLFFFPWHSSPVTVLKFRHILSSLNVKIISILSLLLPQ